jgi:hypothetical protein
MGQRRGGILELKINGEIFDAKGNFSYGLGKNERSAIVGADSVHGYSEKIMAPFIEGEITDKDSLSLDALSKVTDAVITLTVANGKIIVLRGAWCTNPDGLGASTEEGAVKVRFEGTSAEEVR